MKISQICDKNIQYIYVLILFSKICEHFLKELRVDHNNQRTNISVGHLRIQAILASSYLNLKVLYLKIAVDILNISHHFHSSILRSIVGKCPNMITRFLKRP